MTQVHRELLVKIQVVAVTNEDKAREYKRIKDQIKALESSAESIKEDLKEVALQNGGELQAGPFIINNLNCKSASLFSAYPKI